MDSPLALLINPWIYDFSAYDLWMRPVGLLRAAGSLYRQGFTVMFFDCLGSKSRKDNFNCGKFRKSLVKKPEAIKNVPRAFYRYGVPIEGFENYLKQIPMPDIVYVNSGMTYWYIGVREAIRLVRERFGDIKIVLGGIYSGLCRGHALKYSGADEIWNGKRVTDYPLWDMMDSTAAIAVQTSFGCPFKCSYCGTHLLCGDFYQRRYEEAADEIEFCVKKYSPDDIAFYDDALLVNSERHAKPLFREIIKRGIVARFHLPNAVHARFIDRETAVLMKKAGFVTIRIGFETSRQKRQDDKVTNEEFIQAAVYLKEAGFAAGDIGAYTMFGSMDDSPEDAVEDIKFITGKAGVSAKPTSYSLVPGSDDYKRWGFTEDLDPLWHNKTIFPLLNKKYSVDIIRKLRHFAAAKNKELLN